MKKEDKKLDLKEIKKKLGECQKQKADFLAGWQRSRADFLNYKKEEIKRIEEILKYANSNLILKILPILDNFEKATSQISLPENLSPGEKEKINRIVQGFLRIKKQFQDFLKNQGIEEIKTEGEKFNPNFHEAIEIVEAKNKASGIILEEIQKGYILNSKVIRPARVRVVK